MVFLPGADRLPMRNLQNITDEIKQHAHCTSSLQTAAVPENKKTFFTSRRQTVKNRSK